ncbi:hypothetical protein [Tenacibaculum sp. IB213877]|uniref:hypothetical protein n=1 Tax=Tenacibaculum sp. IB213877 TaxID=3097351 RepID=UPI002A5A72A8|nr:hypothetical protein [Tenacibaculum sp. IB213877]MDY0781687.1 hypothetical protein [Tenacibaculum sp. IB213877]
MADKKVNIELSNDEAIVLFEFLGRFNEKDNSSRFEDQSEQKILWDIECILEKELSEPFRADYQDIVKKAREAVRDEKE